mgnify:FL=1
MKKIFKNALLFAAAGLALVSCNNAAKMAELADQVKIECNPEVLEVIAGNIDADVTVTFPASYFNKKAKLEIVPVIKYAGGEVEGEPFMYQGEKVIENWKLVGKDGAQISETVHCNYVPVMEQC